MRQTGRVLVLRAFESMAAAPSPKEPGQLVGLTSRILQKRANLGPGGNMKQDAIYAGIDVAKDRLDGALGLRAPSRDSWPSGR